MLASLVAQSTLRNSFDLVFVEPQFVDQEIIAKYIDFVSKYLLHPEGKFILSTLAERTTFLEHQCGMKHMRFSPNIPRLVYQYQFYANWDCELLNEENEELADLLKQEEESFVEETEHERMRRIKSQEIQSVETPNLTTPPRLSTSFSRVDKNKQLLKSVEYPNLAFYRNQLPSIPHGEFIDAIHNKWTGNYSLLEFHHGYIQWIFCNSVDEGMNHYCRKLTPYEAHEMQNDAKIQKRVIMSYKMMLDFYGIELYDDMKGLVRRAPHWTERESAFTFHNNLRITRLLKSLGEIGNRSFKRPLVDFFAHEILEKDQLKSSYKSLLGFWIKTLDSEDQVTLMNQITEKNLIAQYEKRNALVKRRVRRVRRSRISGINGAIATGNSMSKENQATFKCCPVYSSTTPEEEGDNET
eukprot:CAMPEP_0117455022 /NCGR_PEP_ID=MMETSP0759-20121206/11130_1 /TAXON_ID=63605 /ORGANISM="Percolomonas cosmopolitus, Strain WS" /LENGTH=410 /DNA_ID=CAMNT_0005248283 /DNA_START=134 /DNA_END=1366 /DNA_ORIENTATION=+